MKIVRALFKAVARVVRQFPAMAGWAIAAYKCSAPNLGHYIIGQPQILQQLSRLLMRTQCRAPSYIKSV